MHLPPDFLPTLQSTIVIIGGIIGIIEFAAKVSRRGAVREIFKSFLKGLTIALGFIIGGLLPTEVFYLISLHSPNHLFECTTSMLVCPTITPSLFWSTILLLGVMAVGGAVAGAWFSAWGITSLMQKYFP